DLVYAAAGADQVEDLTPELRRVCTALCHGGFFLRKKESIHGTGSTPGKHTTAPFCTQSLVDAVLNDTPELFGEVQLMGLSTSLKLPLPSYA
ncbi:MAG TPA: hypothetical protein VME66_00370, partial [Candidatus Acidoferrales bacterium]|nr:hypothetical protein [Candidatus Acidoferrales bacterium]